MVMRHFQCAVADPEIFKRGRRRGGGGGGQWHFLEKGGGGATIYLGQFVEIFSKRRGSSLVGVKYANWLCPIIDYQTLH